jgi:hypothetical protein
MNTISGWQALYMSFYSGDLYRHVAKNWSGVGYLYLACLIAGSWLIMSIAAQVIINTALNKYIEPYIEKCPKIMIKGGKLSIDKPLPYVIDISDNSCIDFDTSDDAKLPKGKDIGVIISPTSVRQILGDGTDKSMITFDQLQGNNMEFDQSTLHAIINGIKTWTGVVLFVICTPLMIIFCILQTLIYALIGLIISNVMNLGLSFGQIVRIASVALTPCLVLETLIRCTGHQIPLWGLIAMVIAIGYVIFGVRANASADGPVTTAI